MMNNRRAFTIVELITVVIIIAILLGILLPSFAAIRAKAKEVAQGAQFNAIEIALEAFKQVYGDYPPSDWTSTASPSSGYCGAQKLSEALLGWDLMGFDPNSAWRSDGMDSTGTTSNYTLATLQDRKGPYLELATANVFRLGDLFNNTGTLAPDTNVLCDVFKVRKLNRLDASGKPVTAGTPILYYKANTDNKTIDPTYVPAPNFAGRTYNYLDNKPLVDLGKLTANSVSGLAHPFAYPSGTDYPVFYGDRTPYTPGTTYGGSGIGYGIRDTRIPNPVRPYNPDTYILISAGPDGYYGTADDIHNY
ncbi:MAG: prepilin-type N-terminal cleavage/methylation domain-containing protein [Sedimentisphaerales bacterium]|jgi:prepilin-type N-terminal cleavage/methylation domain-containing protein